MSNMVRLILAVVVIDPQKNVGQIITPFVSEATLICTLAETDALRLISSTTPRILAPFLSHD